MTVPASRWLSHPRRSWSYIPLACSQRRGSCHEASPTPAILRVSTPRRIGTRFMLRTKMKASCCLDPLCVTYRCRPATLAADAPDQTCQQMGGEDTTNDAGSRPDYGCRFYEGVPHLTYLIPDLELLTTLYDFDVTAERHGRSEMPLLAAITASGPRPRTPWPVLGRPPPVLGRPCPVLGRPPILKWAAQPAHPAPCSVHLLSQD